MVSGRQSIVDAIRLTDAFHKHMAVAAAICSAFRDAGTRAVMVGGSAVEFYTAAEYRTGDLDFITAATDRIRAIMDGLGFVNKGGTWVLTDDPRIVVEFPTGPLVGSQDRVVHVELATGTAIDVVSLEDAIVDRIAAAVHWKESDEFALYMAVARYDEIDWKYCLKAAEALECLEATKRIRVRARRQRAALRAS